tara:strand:+ start:385 stop:669 length:285 start_codon:yes stop_codon:yes gene_type:complete
MSETLLAPGAFIFRRWDRRVLCKDRKAASELEKNADSIKNTTISAILITVFVSGNYSASACLGLGIAFISLNGFLLRLYSFMSEYNYRSEIDLF